MLVEKRLLKAALPLIEPTCEGELERKLSGGGLVASGSAVESRDMPGSCRLPDIEPVSDAASSWFRLYAAEPTPLSGVCLNHDGSLAPSDCAIWALDCDDSAGEEGSGVPRGEFVEFLSGPDRTDSGRRTLPDCGRLCHESVPERPNAAALGAGFFGSSSSRSCAGDPVRRCSESSRADCCDGGSMVGVGVSAALSCTSRGVSAAERSDCGVVGLSGESERARSVWTKHQRGANRTRRN